MNVPVCRSRAGSSRADFCGVEPRMITPTPERRPSQLAGINRTLLHMIDDWRNINTPALLEDDDEPSLLLTGADNLISQMEVFTGGIHCNSPNEFITVLFPWMQVFVKVSLETTLLQFKTFLFEHLQPMKVPGFSLEPTDYCFRMATANGYEYFHLEELPISRLPLSQLYPMISLFPREGIHVEKEIAKQIGAIIGYSLNDLDNELPDELKSARAKFWAVTNALVQKRGSGLSHYSFPEERIVSVEDPHPQKLLTLIREKQLYYEVFFRSKEEEIATSEASFTNIMVPFDGQFTPDKLIASAIMILKMDGFEFKDERFLLQLVGQKSYLSGGTRKVLSYNSVRQQFSNFKNPKFVLRRESIVLNEFQKPRPLVKPAYVLSEQTREEIESQALIPSVWTIDENLLIRPMSFSGVMHEAGCKIVATFTFYLGHVVLRRIASAPVSPNTPRWAEGAISTGIYMKDLPESCVLCIELFEFRRERVKQKSFSKDKKDEDGVKRESESDRDDFRDRTYGFSQRHDDLRGWPEFLDMLREREEGIERKDEKVYIHAIAWVNIPLFDWKRIMQFGNVTYNLWPGEVKIPPVGKIGQYKPDGIQAHCRLKLEFSTTVSNRHQQPVVACRGVEDDKWPELFQARRNSAESLDGTVNCLNLTEDEFEIIQTKVNQLLSKRFLDGKITISEKDQKSLWNWRFVIASMIADGLILLMESDIMWENRDRFGEIYSLLLSNQWEQLSVPAAITILSASCTDRLIRKFASSILSRRLDDRAFPLFILPMIQALKREMWAFSDLASILLRRALLDHRTGHKVFWLLRAELILIKDTVGTGNDVFRRIAILLEAFLRGNEYYIANIGKQVHMVERISQLTTMVKNYSKDAATQKLRDMLRENCTGLENIDSPLDPTAVLGELIIDKCKVLGSAKMPLRLCWKNVSPLSEHFLSTYEIIFKNGDDLRQDMLVLQVLEVMDNVWLKRQMDCCLSPYPVLPTGYKVGMIGVVPNSCTIFQIQSEGGKMGTAVKSMDTTFLNKFIRNNSTANEYLECIDRFTMSCVGYSVATFIMGIKDRHNDNIMVSRDGRLFHIDFGHILGHGKKKLGIQRDRVPFVLVEHFLCCIGKGRPVSKDSHDVTKFKQSCIDAYCILWDSRALFLALFTAMQSMELPELSTDEDLDHLKKTLQVSLDHREEAGRYFTDIFDEAFSGSWSTKTNWFFHTVKHM